MSLVIYLVTQSTDDLTSFILGSASSLLMNSLNYRVLKAAFQYQPDSVRLKSISMYIARFVFYGIILFICNTMEGWNLYLAAFGMLTFRIVLIPLTFYYAKKGEGDRLD
ncbi:MAG: hypothetical protein AB7U79_07920 [Candidatus Izemoplasmatales bacterium]